MTVVAERKPKRNNKRERSPRLDNLNSQINETKFHKYIAHDIVGYRRHVANGGVEIYSEKELEALIASGLSDRLPPRATKYYMELASKSRAITNLIKARPEEMDDLSGEADPSNQLKYSPVPGLLHKYELILLYVVRTCSSWCRYCYRSDFLTSKTDKDIGTISQIVDYVTEYNAKVKEGMSIEDVDKAFIDGDVNKFPIREALLSGGDPMVLSNKNLFGYLDGLAEAGIRTIRIGTKELAFFPMRFDDNFFDMIDLFHELHPSVNLAFMVHFSHADELLMRGEDGEYVRTKGYHYTRLPEVEKAVLRLRSRAWVTLENQSPIIDGVNDDAQDLRRLHVELKRLGINNHYHFQCREIEGHKAFAVEVERAWKIHAESQHGLSGIEKSRFVMSTEFGKLEVVSVIEGFGKESFTANIPEDARTLLKGLFGEGLVVFKAHRTGERSTSQGDLVIARRNPKALWINGYEDRILYDGRKEGDERWGAMSGILKTMFAPLVESGMVEQLLDTE
jgi:lysine 2,3-aminomutase